MQRRYNRGYFVLVMVVFFGLTTLVVGIDAHAQIAFTSDRDGNNEIYVMDANGKNLRRLTNDRHGDLEPSWSPGGKRIAFVSDRDWNLEIYVMDDDGKNPRNLSNNPINDWHPSWSPDGKHIAFMSDRDGKAEIYVMDTDGGNRRNLTKNASRDENPSWSPDSKRIAFDSSKDWAPSWSPDGKRIAFVSNRDRKKPEIHVMDTDGGNPRNLTQDPHDDTQPAWYDPTFAVDPVGKQCTMWGWLKQVAQ